MTKQIVCPLVLFSLLSLVLLFHHERLLSTGAATGESAMSAAAQTTARQEGQLSAVRAGGQQAAPCSGGEFREECETTAKASTAIASVTSQTQGARLSSIPARSGPDFPSVEWLREDMHRHAMEGSPKAPGRTKGEIERRVEDEDEAAIALMEQDFAEMREQQALTMERVRAREAETAGMQ